MNSTRIKQLRSKIESESIDMDSLLEIEVAFAMIPDSQLSDARENATAGDMLDEIEAAAINTVGSKIDHEQFNENNNLQWDDMQGLVNALRKNQIVWSWGAHAWMKMNDFCLRFKVNGHHHKGHVYITVAGNDTFTIYLTTTRGTIKQIITDVYVGSLVEILDQKVERIEAYNR